MVFLIKVAIMGAGLSGLACAITLEQNGIIPTIFEKREVVGDRFVNLEIFLSILTKPVTDVVSFLTENYGIIIHPVSNIKSLYIYSENEKSKIQGNLGFISLRGRHNDSLENQFSRQLKSKIIFNSEHTYEELLQEYTHVILATGDAAYTSNLQIFNESLTVSLRGATVEGDFDRYSACAWLNNKLAPKGYGYLIPSSEKEAQIVIGYPDYNDIKNINEDKLWENFHKEVCKSLDQNFRITDQFKVKNYIIGLCNTPRIGNTFFTGNCFGSVMPFLGFGQFASILTGIYAAMDICGKGNYEQLTHKLRESYKNSLALRRGIELLDNKKLDLFVSGLEGRLGERLFNSKYDFLRIGGAILRPIIKTK